MGEEGELITTEDIAIDVPKYKNNAVRGILKKHQQA